MTIESTSRLSETTTSIDVSLVKTLATNIRVSVQQVIVGKSETIDSAILALLCRGHVLLEDVPGTGKTTLAKALASSLDCQFGRIQFTPDLVPGDVLGVNFYNASKGEFEFRAGPVFSQILLADEINRATPRTQSALLEAMQERQVTIGGESFDLDKPFLVMATQNPVEQEGTYPLPEAQVDRFMLKVVIDYPKKEEEKIIIRNNLATTFPTPNSVLKTNAIIRARDLVKEVYMDEKIEQYIIDIVFATRNPKEYGLDKFQEMISFGGSPRASINLAIASKAYAFIKRRGYVIPEDVRALCHDVLRHRIGLTYEAEAENITSEDIITEILNAVEIP